MNNFDGKSLQGHAGVSRSDPEKFEYLKIAKSPVAGAVRGRLRSVGDKK